MPDGEVDVQVGRDLLERVVARAVQRQREGVGIRTEDLRRAVALVDVAVDDDRALRQPFQPQTGERHRDVVEQAVAAGEVVAGVVGAAAEVHPDPVLERPPRRRQRPADRPPAALDQHFAPRQPEPALLADRHLTGPDPVQQVAVVHVGEPFPRHGVALAHGHRPSTRSRSSWYLEIGNLWPSGRGMRKRSWLQTSLEGGASLKLPVMAIYGGIDLGGTKIQAAVVDEGADNTVLGHKRDQTPLKGGPKAIAARMAEVLIESIEEAGLKASRSRGRGRRLAGQRGRREGHRLGGDEPERVERQLQPAQGAGEGAQGAPVSLGNDVDLATDAEFQIGAAKDYQTLLGVFWGTGVGGGLILDGHQWVGRKTAGEIGHMVVRINGAKCGCGRRGCMEAYAGRGAMEARARRRVEQKEKTVLFEIMEERGRDRLSSGIWERALARDDQMALELLEDAVEALGAGVASAVNLLDPEAVVIGGGLGIRLGEEWVERIREAMIPHLFVDDDPPAVMLAELGDLGGAHGGALLASRRAAGG